MTIQDWFDKYGESHQNPTNKAVHWICVPLIFFSIVGILSLIPFGFVSDRFPLGWEPYIHAGTLLVFVGILFFLRLSLSITLGMAVVSALILWLVNAAHIAFEGNVWIFFTAVFVLSWVGQFIGHKIEGAKPSFFDDLKFLMIGPAWLLHFIYRKTGIPY
ncbi:MAG: DUF962 domain-containing protein [Cryomorphaceae bacterium]|nr:DUF962 domain-containing protein [Flavobacteriales bacterium]